MPDNPGDPAFDPPERTSPTNLGPTNLGPANLGPTYLGAGAGEITLALFIDRLHLRAQVREDAFASGFRVVEAGTLKAFAARERASAAAVVMIDCPAPDPASLAALARQDMLTSDLGTQLLVSTQLDALEDVFGCLDQSQPHLLVDPSTADIALALGRARAFSGRSEVHELAEADRLLLLRLADQVSQLAARIERIEHDGDSPSGDRLAAPGRPFRGADAPPPPPAASRRPRLPAPALVRRILRRRRQRAAHFGPDLFADPAWDMLLDLTAARGEGKRVSVTSLCIAASVPATTALRWIAHLTEAGLFERKSDQTDRRRAFIDLTDKAAAGMATFFAALGAEAADLV